MQTRLLSISMATLICACGTLPSEVDTDGRKTPLPVDGEGGAAVRFDASKHTPGYFRDTFRLLEAQALLDDVTAVERLIVDLRNRARDPGELPPMLDNGVSTLEGLLILALRAVQSTMDTPHPSRIIGETLLNRTLGLDPARVAFNQEHPDASVPLTEAGSATLAQSGLWAVEQAAAGAPIACFDADDQHAIWDSGEAEVVWVEEVCEEDRWVGGYCEEDRWIEGECYDVWVPEECSGGHWEDNGYYEYYCYDDDDCYYEWVEDWDYIDGTCTGGYYREDCYPGYWEDGICYDGTFVPGECIPGHYEYRYPDGTWVFASHAAEPTDCEQVRPAQLGVAVAAASVLHGKVLDELAPEWAAALEELVDSGRLQQPDEAVFAAILQILSAVADDA